jgi:DNA-binding MarR family transcriptional regulator
MDLTKSLKKLESHMWQLWREIARESGSLELTHSEMVYLYALMAEPGGMRLTDLAQSMKVSKASASAMTTKLEGRGYLRRIPCPEDGRATLLQATEKSFSLEKEEDNVYRRTAKVFEKALDASEYQEFCRLMAKGCPVIKRE